MPSFTNTLVGVGPICDADFTFMFTKYDVTVFAPDGKPILTGWCEKFLLEISVWHQKVYCEYKSI